MRTSRSLQRYVLQAWASWFTNVGIGQKLYFRAGCSPCCVVWLFAQSCVLQWGPFPGQYIVLFPHCIVTVIVSENKLLCPSSNTPNSFSRSRSLSYQSLFHWCCLPAVISHLVLLSFNVTLLTANQRASKAVDPAGRWVLWQGTRPCTGDKEMGVFSRQALPGLFSPHGQIPNLSGNGARHFLRLQQSCECTPQTIHTEHRYQLCSLPFLLRALVDNVMKWYRTIQPLIGFMYR